MDMDVDDMEMDMEMDMVMFRFEPTQPKLDLLKLCYGIFRRP
jgi:hypothetical protein